ncbi:N-acyl-phosphatidylethanolamine-hydrolyzing phospholipase D [Epithele typhae]|uniref:N-acyl-phosphatidylethanolamine-hydrolyzing phospholipase D n=1 Tax=Epithele typhae TaxID=378194 RepID=UPI0020088996|nr:N-acyl-phosphatidylethanolamine-hydrolyzing phospholipase D [Epithele typhae]KAH9935109.1 N-acyl-phosphatidylethanolamine-hydrolyzing phospholipase D [Epithele typhae]
MAIGCTETKGAARGNVSVEKRTTVEWVNDQPPAHHLNRTQTLFTNPWDSWRAVNWHDWPKAITRDPSVPKDLATLLPTVKPDWGMARPEGAKATWLGCTRGWLVELPAPEGAARGPRILFDPVLSNRASPSQWAGPARLLPPPVVAEDIPEVDVLAFSHNHYDHMDCNTTTTTHINLHDWWEDSSVTVELPAKDTDAPRVPASFTLACTPAQHTAGRTAFDRWQSLWPRRPPTRGARAEADLLRGRHRLPDCHGGEKEKERATCPVFAEIGNKFGRFDLALLPIGAYKPRWMWSGLHGSPADAVDIFKDVKAERALAMHWGTFKLTIEDIMEPPRLLKESCEKEGIPEGKFTTCKLGETTVV